MRHGIRAILVTLLVACSDDAGDDAPDWTTQRTVLGDTTVVRTVGGSATSGERSLVTELAIGAADAAEEHFTFGDITDVDVGPSGELLVMDAQVPALRVYDSSGRFLRTIGRKGEGPGEYDRVNGLAVHRDGRIALWDASLSRINSYSLDGAPNAAWPVSISGRTYTRGALFVDTAGFTYARVRVAGASGPGGNEVNGLMKWSPVGALVDSLEPPVAPIAAAQITARVESASMTRSVPFARTNVWAWSPLGYFVSANTGSYAILLHRPAGGPLRIEREIEPVPVQPEERANEEEVATASMRNLDPTWRWNGPPIPETKPWFQSVGVGRDGRIWVRVSRPGERIPESELAPPERGNAGQLMPVRRWRAPGAYDVFEADGEFLGRVLVPFQATLLRMEGDRAWGYVRDSLDVQQVARFRIQPGFTRR